MNNECVIIRKEEFDKTLTNIPVSGKRVLEPLKTLVESKDLPFKIIEDSNVPDFDFYEVHKRDADLFYCLEGELVFAYGGEMIDPYPVKKGNLTDEDNLLSKEIKNEKQEVLKPGDWMFVPAGQPHSHKCVGTSRFIVIKIPKK